MYNTWCVSLKHLDLLLVVGSAEELSLLDDELVALLEAAAAHDAHETPEVEGAVQRPHHQLLGTHLLRAAEALLGVQPAGR